MRTPVFVVLEGPEFGGARTNSAYPRVLSEVLTTTRPTVRLSLGNREALAFAVPATDEMRQLLAARRVVKLTPEGEEPTEWLVSRTVDSVTPGGVAALIVECDPIWAIMGDAGIIEQVTPGGQSYANLGGVNGRVANYLATYAIPTLQRRGISWIELGSIEPMMQFDLSWDANTPLQLLNAATANVGAEWEFERDEAYSRYLIQVTDRIGALTPVVRVREGLDILQVDAQRTREKLYTAIRPQGDLETGGEERANIGMATWRVTDVTGDVVTLEAHNEGPGPVLEDGQHVGLYLEAMDGTWWEIVDSTAPDELELEAGAGAEFAAIDDVMIVADDQGTLLTELQSPSGIANFGYTQGSIAQAQTGYRNWVRNPFASSLTTPEVEVVKIRLTGDGTATAELTDAPDGFSWGTDDVIHFSGRFRAVTNSGTKTGGSAPYGNITIAMGVFGSGVTDYTFFKNANTFHPRFYDPFAESAFIKTEGVGQLEMTGAVNGAQDLRDSAPLAQTLAVDGLPPNQVIPAGSLAVVTLAGAFTVTTKTTTNGSGQVNLPVPAGFATDLPVDIADNRAVVIRTPPFAEGVVVCGVVDGDAQLPSTALQATRLDPQLVFRLIPGFERLVVTARFAALGATAWTSSTAPSLRVLLGSTSVFFGRAVNTATAAQYSAGSVTAIVDPLQSDDVGIQIEFPRLSSVWSTTTWLTGLQVALTSEDNPAIVEGSQATRLFQAGNLALAASRQWPSTYSATVQEMASAWNLPIDSPAFKLGAYIHLVSPSAGIDQLLRVTEIDYDPFDPDVKRLILDTDPDRITQITAKQKARPVFVDVDVTVDNDGKARETVLASENPPVVVPGVNRFVVESGVVPLVNVLNVELLTS
jgi:hypothetical protein